MTKMSKMEENKWAMYLMYGILIAVFGMIIYLVVMAEDHEDKYYGSIVFYSSGTAVPVYPNNAEGTLDGGIEQVRDAVASFVDRTADVNFSVPHKSDWKLSVVPQMASTTAQPTAYRYHYSFPLLASELNDAGRLVEDVLGGNVTYSDLFSGDDLTWANEVFTDPNDDVSFTIGYGTRDAGTLGNTV